MTADKIIEKILDDAAREKERILEHARQAASDSTTVIAARTKESIEALEVKTASDEREVERRRMLTASLDARKQTLASRRELLDRAFSAAIDHLCALPDDQYGAIVERMVLDFAETGSEYLIIPRKEEKRYTGKDSLLTRLNEALKKAGKKGELTVSCLSDSFRGGLLICGETYDTDCSFDSLLSRVREEKETQVAKILFESGV